MEEVPVFKAMKRRKLARPQHEFSPERLPQPVPPNAKEVAERPEHGNVDHDEDARNDVAISNLIRARKQARRPVTGVQFSTAKMVRGTSQDEMPETSNEVAEKSIDISDRFVGSTGQVVNVDKHMFVASLSSSRYECSRLTT
jgi:hypothetical protein